MKKQIGIHLLQILAGSVLCCNVFYFSSMILSKIEAYESTDAQQIVLSENQLQNIHGKEINIDGQMYDIYKVEQSNGQYIASVHKDDRETKLLHLFKSKRNSDIEISLLSFLTLISDVAASDIQIANFVHGSSAIFTRSSHITDTHIEVIAPPPNFI